MKRKDIMLGRLNELLLPLGYEHITTPGINGFFKVYPNYIDLFTVGFYLSPSEVMKFSAEDLFQKWQFFTTKFLRKHVTIRGHGVLKK